MKVWTMRWRDHLDIEYISIGLNRDFAPAYMVEKTGLAQFGNYPALMTTGMTFMIDPMRRTTLAKLEKRYGKVPPMEPLAASRDLLATSANEDDRAAARTRPDSPLDNPPDHPPGTVF